MAYRVVLYCPDRHLTYDGRTPDEVGVGGGVTARVRMGRALARLGHEVTQVVNCPRRELIDGVEYVPLDEVSRLKAEVIVFNTSGGGLDLSPARALDCSARLRIVWAHGTQAPHGLESLSYDAVYAVSNYVGQIAIQDWRVPPSRLFVSYNCYDVAQFNEAEREAPARNGFRLVYFTHPSKGLATALGVIARLRMVDRRFHLEVYGGPRLWGGHEGEPLLAEGVHYHGLVGQKTLIPALLGSTYGLQMQGREEPGALAILDASRAGCIVVASPVGCYIEQVQDEVNGLLVPGDHLSDEVQEAAVAKILRVHGDRERGQALSSAAKAIPWDSHTMARVWISHWEALLGRRDSPTGQCLRCGSPALVLADGLHCPMCGIYGAPVRSLAACSSSNREGAA